MPLLNELDFAATGLFVDYRASGAPQELVIEVEVSEPPEYPAAISSLATILKTINLGGAGGAIFPPSSCAARLLEGPWWQTEGDLATTYRWRLEVAAVAPRFLRNMVEELRRCGAQGSVVSLRIAGALLPGDDALSVRQPQIRAWLDDPTAYPEAWPRLDFKLLRREARKGVPLRVRLSSMISAKLRDGLEELAMGWKNAVRDYVDAFGNEVELDPFALPRFGKSKDEFRAWFEDFNHAPEPSLAMLCNMLTRFHETAAPIVEVEVGS